MPISPFYHNDLDRRRRDSNIPNCFVNRLPRQNDHKEIDTLFRSRDHRLDRRGVGGESRENRTGDTEELITGRYPNLAGQN